MRQRQQKGLGWRPDLPDHRDVRFAKLLRGVDRPDIVSWKNDPAMISPFSQQISDCTGNGVSGAVTFRMRKTGLPPIGPVGWPSRLMIYYLERLQEGTVPYDAGACIRDGIKAIAQYGVVDESEWPYDISKFAEAPPQSCYEDAAKHVISQYMAVDQTPEAFESAIAQAYPVVFGFSCYESFMGPEVAHTGVVPMPASQESLVGGHCVFAVGYDRNQRLVTALNSWGPGWGQSGFFELPYDYIFNPDLASDLWAIETVAA